MTMFLKLRYNNYVRPDMTENCLLGRKATTTKTLTTRTLLFWTCIQQHVFAMFVESLRHGMWIIKTKRQQTEQCTVT